MHAGDSSSSGSPLDPASGSLQRRAAEWVALRKARSLAPAEISELAQWCAADPRHERILLEVEAADRVFDRLAFYPRDQGAAVDPDLLGPRPRRVFGPALVGLAAALALAAIVSTKFSPSFSVAPVALVQTGPRFLRLPDGSGVELNTGSEVVEHFTEAERLVRLVRGEAHFTVTKNPRRPFIVQADGVSVRAVGTAFDVRLEPTAVDVLVTEGKVGVTTSAAQPAWAPAQDAHRSVTTPAGLGPGLILVAGERTVVPTAPALGAPARLIVETLARRQIDRALAWQDHELIFDAMPLSEVVARLNRSAIERGGPGVRLSVRGADLAAMRISGRVRYDNIDDFVGVLETDFGVTAERRDSEIILRTTR